VGQSDWVVPDETGWRVGGHPAWLHTPVGPKATAYVIDPTRSGAVAGGILGLDYDGTMIHDGWSPYDQFEDAHRQQCLNHITDQSIRRSGVSEAFARAVDAGGKGYPNPI
jgi:transposase